MAAVLARAGKAAVFAADEFFYGRVRNEHTRAAYLIAIRRFLQGAETRGLELRRITPKDVGQYFDQTAQRKHLNRYAQADDEWRER